jgi:hypothetical protein
MYDQATVAAALKLRSEHGASVQAIAAELGVNRATVATGLRGQTPRTLELDRCDQCGGRAHDREGLPSAADREGTPSRASRPSRGARRGSPSCAARDSPTGRSLRPCSSRRTVEYHLGAIYRKLRISSREELAAALDRGPTPSRRERRSAPRSAAVSSGQSQPCSSAASPPRRGWRIELLHDPGQMVADGPRGQVERRGQPARPQAGAPGQPVVGRGSPRDPHTTLTKLRLLFAA